MNAGETSEETMYRELHEELGISSNHVFVLGQTAGWLRYRLPKSHIRPRGKKTCVGQKQRWYLLALNDAFIQPNLDVTDHPEFDAYQWVSYWYPLGQVIPFKRDVYRRAMTELAPVLRWFGPMAC